MQTKIIIRDIIVTGVLAVLIVIPEWGAARDNVLTVGLGTGVDYSDREYSEPDIEAVADDDYNRIFVTPLVQLVSTTPRDSIELRAAPWISYDTDESETEWNSDFYAAAMRHMTREWQVEISNAFLISDYYRTDTIEGISGETDEIEAIDLADPELDPNQGRERYWRNTLTLASDYTYGQDSLWGVDLSYIALRYDDDEFSDDDYDRYLVGLRNQHRYSAAWDSEASLRFIRGDFEEIDPDVATGIIEGIAPEADIELTDDDLSRDLREYRFYGAINNHSFDHNVLSAAYNFIGARYDETLRDDIDINQVRFTWERDFTEHLNTTLGIGPSYQKVENRDGEWAGNGIAGLNYTGRRSTTGVSLEKRYDIDSFSGTGELGFTDAWIGRFDYTQQMLRSLSVRANLYWFYEDREDPVYGAEQILEEIAAGGDVSGISLEEAEEYHRDTFLAGLGLDYTFMQNYTASLSYFFTKRESDQEADNYDEHRVLFQLSWRADVMRW